MKQKNLLLMISTIVSVLLFVLPLFSATTGKIAGRVVDQETGEPLPGANVIVEGTLIGATTDLDGYYSILKVPPGSYTVKVEFVGYASTNITNVIVNIDQTTRLDMELVPTTLVTDAIVVVAEHKQVQIDVSTSKASVQTEEIAALPVSSVSNVVGLQAGAQGLNIRGSDPDKSLMLVDGVTMRDPRNNQPISSIPLSAVQEVSVQRGGFNAEYGQVQAGIINVVTKEGHKNKYNATLEYKYAPPQRKYMGISPYDPDSHWLKPYLDDDVCWTGTNSPESPWNEYTRDQYPEFNGWNEISDFLMTDSDPTNDLSPRGAQQVFMFERRFKPDTDVGDKILDAGLGGPVPFISKYLGDLRFYTSYRREDTQLLIPLNRDNYLQWDYQLQLISDISPSLKLRFNTMFGKNYTQSQNWVENYFIRYSYDIANDVSDASLWGTGTYGDAVIDYQTYNLKLTHSLSTSTFYEVSLEHLQRNYDIHAPDRWDRTQDNEILPGYYVDDMPYGFWPELGTTGIEGSAGYGGHTARYKDESNVSTTTIKADLVSQVNFENQFAGGIEVVFNSFDLKYGRRDQNDENIYDIVVDRTDSPLRLAAYVQDKLEVYGFIANLGLRFDYSNSNTQWYGGDVYDPYYFGGRYDPDAEYELKDTEAQYQISPRVGISHPITENSKLFFNYGHFKQLPTYEALLREQRGASNDMEQFGDPGLILAKTVAYELGYDYSIANQFLIQLAGYYKDITDQQYDVQRKGRSVGYEATTNNGYEDIRGLEITLRKSTGRWISGFANYTYEARSTGNFGPDELYQNPSLQREFNSKAESFQQEKLVPRPYARLNLRFTTPRDYGSDNGLEYLMSDWMLNFIGNWQSGNWQTYNENGVEGVTLNVQEKDYINLDLRLGKSFSIDKWSVSLYMDAFNVLNIKRLSNGSFSNATDDRPKYMASLHLPKSDAYPNIPGDDRIGDYRANGVEFQPIKRVYDITNNTFEEGVIYYYEGKYYENDANTQVDSDKMDKIMEDKAYIDMPNKSSFWYLNPRHIVFGFRINYNF